MCQLRHVKCRGHDSLSANQKPQIRDRTRLTVGQSETTDTGRNAIYFVPTEVVRCVNFDTSSVEDTTHCRPIRSHRYGTPVRRSGSLLILLRWLQLQCAACVDEHVGPELGGRSGSTLLLRDSATVCGVSTRTLGLN
ncbi:hypothetical protein J6590_033475 [Homalodisca vitripennis]|nr:hypothetical protein J6590_033475 [Homalodisca vitripennis]